VGGGIEVRRQGGDLPGQILGNVHAKHYTPV
jgi:hypothetical protein